MAGWWLALVLLAPLGEVDAADPQAPERPVSPARSPEWLDPAGIRGALLLVGGGDLPDGLWQRFRDGAPGDNPCLVIIPTARRQPQHVLTEQQRTMWERRGFARVELLHADTDSEADDARVAALLSEASAVWLAGGNQARLTRRYLGTEVERQLGKLLERGGIIGGTSAGAAVMSRVMIAGGRQVPRLASGFDWLPDAVVDQHFTERQRQDRLRAALVRHPGRWGVGLDEGTGLLITNRRMEVVGSGSVTLCLAPSEHGEAVTVRLTEGDVADLTAWRRAARERLLPGFPPRVPADPELPAGALVIAGGGGLPREIVQRFLDLAGGPEARIVVLPTALPDPLPADRQLVGILTRAGARHVTVLRDRHREGVEDEAFLEAIRQAGGVWFGGGRQWRFVDAYEGTRAHQALQQLLARGGVIGGSSAGASIQAEYLVRGNPLGNHDMMALGYQRGLGFLPGTAIDQHFTQRNRARDLATVIERHPQLLGIGIDEETALVVQGQVGEVLGTGGVHFWHASERMATSMTAGTRFDLKARRPLEADPRTAVPSP
jgi:cyanophycinase